MRDLLGSLDCDRGCHHLVVTSQAGAAVWQNKRTGLFTFIGEHAGRPLYQKNSTKEYLYYVNGSEWMIGPDFRKAHAGQWEEIRPVKYTVYGNQKAPNFVISVPIVDLICIA